MLTRGVSTILPRQSTTAFTPSHKLLRSAIVVHRRFLYTRHLEGLNTAQLEAVTFAPDTPLRILAGPGTGKTRVLAARIVDLILNRGLPPHSIHALTFTRKGAGEMKNRLLHDLSKETTDLIGVGTFHSVCIRYLQKYGAYLNIPPNFLLWDEDDCITLIWYIALHYNSRINRKEAAHLNQEIARAKSNGGQTPKEIFRKSTKNITHNWADQLWDGYHTLLKNANALDFEDLQIRGLELFERAPQIPNFVQLQHILVDEFQDNSSRQYELIKKFFTATNGCATVVGDPDQSIYGWRDADPFNSERLKQDLPQTHDIWLEENFRSTGSILAVANAIIEQDVDRPKRKLYSTHTPNGPKPFLQSFEDATLESRFIAEEIRRITNTSDGVLNYEDIAVLVRGNYPPEELKSALEDNNIPFQVLPNYSKWDASEIKVLLAYLYLMVDAKNDPKTCFLLEGPHQAKTKGIVELVAQSISGDRSLGNVLADICGGVLTDTKPSIKRGGSQLLSLIQSMRELENNGASVGQLLRLVREEIRFDSFLDKEWPEQSMRRKGNVDRFIAYAERYIGDQTTSAARSFLNHVWLKSKTEHVDDGKVSILTCHSAKGLEWPVVFIPEVVDGVHPHIKSRSEGVDESRRLFYVACTRAQCLLYMTLSKMKTTGRGDKRETLKLYPSPFIEKLSPELFSQIPPELDDQTLQLFRKMLKEHE